MILIEYLFAASLLGVSAYAVPPPPYQTPLGSESKRFSRISEHTSLDPHNDNLDKWITEESEFAWEYLFDNVAPYGKNTGGAAPGTVIASPSKSYPDYFYQWVRDAAITMKGVVNAYAKTDFQNLRDTVELYLEIQENIQSTANPSGGYSSGGLGEPKFMVNGEPFTQPWSRPQRDGPALRILTLTSYIKTLNETEPELVTEEWLTKLYDPTKPNFSIIKADLEYIARTWNEQGFDLWEETMDLHFFTALVQHKALVEGRDLARLLNDQKGAAWYDRQQSTLKGFLKDQFWSKEKGHLLAYLNTPHRTGLDCSLMLGAIHGGQSDLFPAWSDEVLVSMQMLINDMEKRHSINRQAPPYYKEEERLRGVGIGRYPEDIYDGVGFSGGHPWFLCTSSVSEILYTVIEYFVKQESFEITPINLPFFNRMHPNGKAEVGIVTVDDLIFHKYLRSMFTYADSFLNVIRWHATADGRLSEQFDGRTGFQRGAHDLTWSYGSFLEAVEKRKSAKLTMLNKL